MEISKHISFRAEKSEELMRLLQDGKIACSETRGLVSFDIYVSSPVWPAVERIVRDKGFICLSNTVFTKEELACAEWLRIRSRWHNGYPQPEDDFAYKRITCRGKEGCRDCGVGMVQTAPFRIKSQPKWGTRHFFSLNWVPDELFVDEIAKACLVQTQLTGFSFLPVENKKGGGTIPGVYQLKVEASAAPGLIEGGSNLREVVTCSTCGIKHFHPSGVGMHTFCREALEGMPDMCKTFEHFGWGRASYPLILIRQSVYQSIVKNRLGRSLEFLPIEVR